MTRETYVERVLNTSGVIVALRARNLSRNVSEANPLVETVAIREEDGTFISDLMRRDFPNGPWGAIAFVVYRQEFYREEENRLWTKAAEKDEEKARAYSGWRRRRAALFRAKAK